MSAFANSSHLHAAGKMSSSFSGDLVLSVISPYLGNINGWTIVITALLAIIIYDQGNLPIN
jgi:hypothetical protein